MSFLSGFFGPKRDVVWQQLADEVGGNFFEGGLWLGDSKVRAHVGGWMVTLDTYRNDHGTTFTRIHAPYINTDDFTFTLFRQGSFEDRHRTDRDDIEIGQADFDKAFVIKSNNIQRVKQLFEDEKVRQLLARQREVHLHARHDEGWFNKEFPQGMHELSLETRGEIKNLDRLKELYELFGETLQQLCRIGAAADRDPGIVI